MPSSKEGWGRASDAACCCDHRWRFNLPRGRVPTHFLRDSCPLPAFSVSEGGKRDGGGPERPSRPDRSSVPASHRAAEGRGGGCGSWADGLVQRPPRRRLCNAAVSLPSRRAPGPREEVSLGWNSALVTNAGWSVWLRRLTRELARLPFELCSPTTGRPQRLSHLSRKKGSPDRRVACKTVPTVVANSNTKHKRPPPTLQRGSASSV